MGQQASGFWDGDVVWCVCLWFRLEGRDRDWDWDWDCVLCRPRCGGGWHPIQAIHEGTYIRRELDKDLVGIRIVPMR
jgi:hypothetical protein